MFIRKFLILFVLLMPWISSADQTFQKSIRPLLEKYCFKCHDEDVQKGDIRLDLAMTEDDVVKERKLWLRSLHQLEEEEMPPKKPFPSDDELKTLISWFDKTLNHYDWSKVKNPGYVSLSRLTNEEYKNSVRDLFGIDFHKGSNWVSDPEGDSGFTNDRDNLSISINSLSKYLVEAEEYADALISLKEKQWQKTFALKQNKMKMTDGSPALLLRYETDPHRLDLTFPYTGLYKLKVRASAQNQPITGIRVMLNGRKVFGKSIHSLDPQILEVPVFAKKGFSTLMIYISQRDAALYSDDRIKFPASKELIRKIKAAAKNPPQLKIPDKYKNNAKVLSAFKKVNQVAARCYQGKHAAQIYMSMDQMPDDLEPVRGLLKGSVPTNINNGRLAVLLGISTKDLFQRWKDETGEDFGVNYASYAKIRERFKQKYNEQYGHRKQVMGRLLVSSISFEGPYLPEESKKITSLFKLPQNVKGAEKILSYYTSRAFRKPVSEKDYQPFLDIYNETMSETSDHYQALRDSIVSLLISPGFLLHRNELGKSESIDQFQIASRLSYMFWQSLPDKELLSIASKGTLKDPAVINQQIQRMTKDQRFLDFCSSFTEEWLDLEKIGGVSAQMKEAMKKEPQLLVNRIFQENRNIFEMINADYTYLNELLARHYDIEGVKGMDMRLVSLSDKRRGGLLTMGSMLAATSLPNRTSPVQRGAWIVETILGEELPPPPDGVPELSANAGKGAKTLRQELEIHRQDPKCSGCHDRIDPYGFILENFDRLGRWRDKNHNKKIDSKMVMKNGQVYKDVTAFKNYMYALKKDDIRRNLVERVLSFALGRKLQYYDEPAIMKIIQTLKENNDKSHSLLSAVVQSYPFLNQKIQEEDK